MNTLQLNVENRETGKTAATSIRRAGNVPATLYGGSDGAVSLTINDLALRKALRGPMRRNAVLALDGATKANAMVREIQVHPIKDQIIHVDLMRVEAEKPVIVDVPIKIVGESPGVVMAGGAIDTPRRSLRVRVTPANIPETIEVSIDGLHVGQGVVAGKVPMPENVELVTADKAPVVVIQSTRATKLMKTSGEGEAGAETPDGA